MPLMHEVDKLHCYTAASLSEKYDCLSVKDGSANHQPDPDNQNTTSMYAAK